MSGGETRQTVVRLQAEAADSLVGYAPETLARADGGQLIWVPTGQTSGTATYAIGERLDPGVWRLDLGHVDENDGKSPITITVVTAGVVTFSQSFVLNDATGGNGTQAASFRVRSFEGIEVGPDTTLTITGARNGGEHARIDYLEFVTERPNAAPTTAGLGDQAVRAGQAFTLPVADRFADADGDPLSVTVAGPLPDGVVFADGVFSGVATTPGAYALTLAASDGSASVATDFTLTVLPEQDRQTLRVEAESFARLFGFAVETLSGGRQVISLARNQAGAATLDLAALGASGAYELRVAFYDENDGVSSAQFSLDQGGGFAPLGAWLFDQDGGANGGQAQNLRVLSFSGLEVGPGATLRLDALANLSESARIDYIELVPVGTGGAVGNRAPTLTGPAAISVAENAAAVASFLAQDADGDTLVFGLAGADAALFEIGADGALRFRAAPDFETPLDQGRNNVYDLSVTASDGRLTVLRPLAVTVTDVAETPTSATGHYLAQNGRVKIQLEDFAGGAAAPAGWVFQNAANGNNAGFQGAGYYYWKDQLEIATDNRADQGVISTTIYVETAGVYNLRVRAARDTDDPRDQRNDIWVKIDDSAVDALPPDSPEMVSNLRFLKLVGVGSNGAWGWAQRFDSVDEAVANPTAQVVLGAGFHTLTLAGRSQGFHADFIELYMDQNPTLAGVQAPAPTAPNSTFVPAEGPPTPGELTATIAASADDFEAIGGAKSSDLDLGRNDGKANPVGLRFTGLELDAAAAIDDAHFVFQASEASAGPSTLTIQIENSLSGGAFTSASNLNGRAYLAQTVTWADPEGWAEGQFYRSADVSALIEAVMGSGGLDALDALSFRISGTGAREVHSFDSSGAEPRLVITYDDMA